VVLPSTFVLYATYRYGWDEKTVGLTLAMVGLLRDGGAGHHDRARSSRASGGAQGVAVWTLLRRRRLLNFRCGADRTAVLARYSDNGLVGHCQRRHTGIDEPACLRRISKGPCRARPPACRALSQLVGPFLFTLTFAYFIGNNAPWIMPGAPFLLAL